MLARRLGFSRDTLKGKMIGSFVLIVCIVIAVAVFNSQQMEKIRRQIEFQNNENNKKLLALELKLKVNQLDAMKSELIISKSLDTVEAFNENRTIFQEYVKMIAGTASTPEQRKMSAFLTNTSVEYTATFDQAVAIASDDSLTPEEMNIQLAGNYNLSKVHKEYIFELIGKFYDIYASDAQQAVEASTLLMKQADRVATAAACFVMLATAAVGFYLIRSFTRPIARLQKAVAQLAEGDLRHTINSKSRDELGLLSASFDRMVAQVRGMLGSTQHIASSLSAHSASLHQFSQMTATANTGILKAIGEISTGASDQADKSEQSTELIAELEREIGDMAEDANEMLVTSLAASANTGKGTAAVGSLQQAAAQSQAVLHKVDAAMQSLSSSSRQIDEIVRSIADISAQTNVLALNAAIEAARAGAHGRGFSVIADEVRQLSQQANDSSKMVGGIIQALQQQIQGLQSSLAEAREQTVSQNSRVADTLDAFTGIEHSMQCIAGQIERIHIKIGKAREKNDKLVESVQFVAAIAQQTAAGVDEVNAASNGQDGAIHRMAEQADGLRQLSQQLFGEISKFRIAEADRPLDGLSEDTAADAEPREMRVEERLVEEASGNGTDSDSGNGSSSKGSSASDSSGSDESGGSDGNGEAAARPLFEGGRERRNEGKSRSADNRSSREQAPAVGQAARERLLSGPATVQSAAVAAAAREPQAAAAERSSAHVAAPPPTSAAPGANDKAGARQQEEKKLVTV